MGLLCTRDIRTLCVISMSEAVAKYLRLIFGYPIYFVRLAPYFIDSRRTLKKMMHPGDLCSR